MVLRDILMVMQDCRIDWDLHIDIQFVKNGS